jgi:tetratricopeptide (TPR) repeat protein
MSDASFIISAYLLACGVLMQPAQLPALGWHQQGCLTDWSANHSCKKNYGEGLARYSMLEPVRQYALVKLKESGEEEAMRQAHLDYYLECAEHLSSQMSQMKLTEWLALFNAVQIQFRSALTWASKTQARASQNEKALRLAVAANQGWHILGHYNEGLSALKAPFVLCDAVRDPATARLRALAMHHMIFHLDSLTDWVGHQALQPACEACLRQCQENHDVLGEAHAHHVMSCIALSRQDVHLGRAHAEICFSMFVELGDAYGIWGSSPLLAYAYKLSGLQDERIATLQKAIDKLESLKAIWYVVDPLRNLSGAMIELGDMAQAVNLLIKTLEYSIILDDHYIRLWSIELLEVADYFLAHQWAETFLKHQRETHETNRIAAALHQLGRILLDGDGSGYERSAVLLDEAIEHWRLCGIRWARTDSLAHTLVTRGQLARFMGDSRQASLCLETAIQIARDANDRDLLAWAQLWRGYLLAESDIDRAVSQLKHCLANFLDWRYSALNVVTLALLSDLYRRRYTDVTAFTLFGACAAHAHALAIVLQHARRDFDRILMSAQNELSDPAVLAAWNKGRAMTLAQATALALQ